MPRKPEEKSKARKRRGRGEGGIYRRKDGVWCASVSAGYGDDGKRRRKVVYGSTKGEVAEKLRGEQIAGVPTESCRLTVAEFLVRWLETSVKPALAPGTYNRYEQVVRLHLTPHVGHMRLAKLEPIHVQHLFTAQEKAGASARQRELSGVVLQKAYRDAVRLKLVRYNPCVDVEKPRPQKREMRTWNAAQASAFLKAAKDDRFSAMWVLALTTGMRQGELFGLEWSDIDFEHSTLMVQRTLEEIGGVTRLKEPKTKKSRRRIDLPQVAVEALQSHRKAMLAEGNHKAPVFCNHGGHHLLASNVRKRSFLATIKRANKADAKQAEETGREPNPLPVIRVHDLRHTAATLLLLQGVHAKIVSERLGHAAVAITLDTYSHVLPTMQKSATEKLDKLFG